MLETEYMHIKELSICGYFTTQQECHKVVLYVALLGHTERLLCCARVAS